MPLAMRLNYEIKSTFYVIYQQQWSHRFTVRRLGDLDYYALAVHRFKGMQWID